MSAIEQGFLKQKAAIDFLDSVRMVYTYHMIYPYIQATFECDDGRDMDQESCKTLCALTGAAVFTDLYLQWSLAQFVKRLWLTTGL